MSIPADVADAVTAAINAAALAGTFAPWEFAAQRTYIPPRDLEEIQGLTVLVLASAEVKTMVARGKDSFLITVQSAVVKKIDLLTAENANEQIDKLIDLTQAIDDELRVTFTAAAASWQATRRAPLYDAESLLKQGIFQAVSEHDYLVVRTTP